MDARGKTLLCTLLGVAFAACPAQALTRSGAADTHRFVTGGIGEGEIQRLKSEHERFSLWAITAAKGSGAYLADANVRIENLKSGQVAFDSALDGPFLMIDLPAGRYRVEARYHDEVQRRPVHIGPASHRQVVFYFDAPDVDARPWVQRQAVAK